MISTTRRLAWQLLAWTSFALGVIGAFVPLLPSTCFLLVAVWAASKGSPRFARWIRSHPRFGPAVVAWEESGAIPRHAKWMALAMLLEIECYACVLPASYAADATDAERAARSLYVRRAAS